MKSRMTLKQILGLRTFSMGGRAQGEKGGNFDASRECAVLRAQDQEEERREIQPHDVQPSMCNKLLRLYGVSCLD